MYRISIPLQASCWILCILGSIASVRGDEPADAKLHKLFDESRARAEHLRVKVAIRDRTIRPMLHPDPVMKEDIVANNGVLRYVVLSIKKEDSPDLTGTVLLATSEYKRTSRQTQRAARRIPAAEADRNVGEDD